MQYKDLRAASVSDRHLSKFSDAKLAAKLAADRAASPSSTGITGQDVHCANCGGVVTIYDAAEPYIQCFNRSCQQLTCVLHGRALVRHSAEQVAALDCSVTAVHAKREGRRVSLGGQQYWDLCPQCVAEAKDPALTEARQQIEDELVMKCPACHVRLDMQPDFDGCFALYCTHCPARPCAWCWSDVGPDNSDAHAHVRTCSEAPEAERRHRHGALYCRDRPHDAPHPKQKFDEHWRARKREPVRAVLQGLDDEVAALLRQEMRMQLDELGL